MVQQPQPEFPIFPCLLEEEKGGFWERKLHEQEGRKQEWQNHTTAETREGTEMNEDPKDWERL